MQGDKINSNRYKNEADQMANLIVKLLWDKESEFFKVMRQNDIPNKKLADVRELFGYVPWYYAIPPKNMGYENAWKQLMDKDGFYAPYGPTSAEQRHPQFKIVYQGHDCQFV